MEWALTIHPISIMNGRNKNRGRDKPIKITGPILQGMVKTQLEIVEVGKSSLYPHRCILYIALNV